MKIQELEQLSGLDRATIRFYEKQELLFPVHLENGTVTIPMMICRCF